MSERDHLRTTARGDAASGDAEIAVGRSRSQDLVAPTHPIVSALLHRKSRDTNGVADDASAHVAAASAGSGTQLPATLMRKFASSLGADLSSVRLHTDAVSATAADSVGARAYTVGQDIHFGAGHYDPSSSAGEHLLAHEVAHTVQQQGSTPTRQNKLEVSSPGDALEVEADRAADAMVTGQNAAIASSSITYSRSIHRDKDPDPKSASDDKEWAASSRTQIDAVQTAANAAMQTLNADAAAAAGSFEEARRTCSEFEKLFKSAKETFTSHVHKAIEEQKEFEEMLTSCFEFALAAGSLGAAELGTAAEGIVEGIERIHDVMTVIGGIAAVSNVGKDTKKEKGEPGGVNAGSSGVDWKQLLDKTLATFKGYIAETTKLSTIGMSCATSIKWLTAVVEGHGAANARHTKEGISADKLAVGSGKACQDLAAIGTPFGKPAAGFAGGVHSDLTQMGLGDQKKIEQNIAIRWLAKQRTSANGATNTGFGGRGSAEIHAANEYLASLGVLGKGGRLGVDTGAWDTDTEDDLIVARARVEASAMKLLGKPAEWQGGKQNGAIVTGHVKADESSWAAQGPAAKDGPGLVEAAGGFVRVGSYTIAPTTKAIEDAQTGLREALIHDLVTLSVTATGPMGHGTLPDSPSIKPAPGSRDDD